MSNDGLGDSTSNIEQPVTLTAQVNSLQQEENKDSNDAQLEQTTSVTKDNEPTGDSADAAVSGESGRESGDHAVNDGDNDAAAEASKALNSNETTSSVVTEDTATVTSSEAPRRTSSTADLPASSTPDAAAIAAIDNRLPADTSTSSDNADTTGNTTSAPSTTTASSTTPVASIIASADLEKAPSEGSTSNAGSSTTPAGSTTKTTAPKKFTSSLSMNKKFLGKSGATDAKSPQPASASVPKAGISPAARSPALASPGIPAHPGTSASPPITASSSAPRLLTGKLSSLASGSASGSATAPSSATTWGRPGLTTGAPAGAAFGKSGFVPAGQIGGPPGSAGPRLGGAPAQQSLGRMRGAFGQQSRAGQAPWAGANRGSAGFSRGGLDQDFPSFQEAARAEEQRQHALLAKERAEKMAAVAQAAYNQRVLDGLKSFSGEYTSSTTHWDELDDDDDDLGDVLEFADGMRYEVPQSATLPTEAETAAFQEAAKAESEAAALHAEYQESLAREQSGKAGTSSGVPSPADKSERFVDDFDRGAKSRAQAEQQSAPAASRQPASGRTLFNDRLGRFEPYAGRVPPTSRKDSKDGKTGPPALLQRPSRGAMPSQEQAKAPPQRTSDTRQVSNSGKSGKSPLSPTSAKAQAQVEGQQQKKPDPAPRKVESPWAKLPPVVQEPITTERPTDSKGPASSLPAASAAPPAPATQPDEAIAAPSSSAPAEDPEEAYKREMRSIAEQARKRRQEEEAEREAQKERARKKAQELEEKIKASQKDAPAPTPTSAKPTPTAILSPPASKSDRQSNWRKPSIDMKASQDTPKQIISSHEQVQPNGKNTTTTATSGARQIPAERKTTPSAAAFEALANNASTTWRPPRDDAAPALPPTEKQATGPAPEAGQAASVGATAGRASNLQDRPVQSSEAEEVTSPSAAPRVRLGRRTSPRDSAENGSKENLPQAFGVPHAFPQPTILVSRGAKVSEGQGGAQPVSALDKIMSQVRAAQDDLKTRQAAAAMLEDEKRKMQSSSKKDFDGALDRISQALSQATIKAKPREGIPAGIKMNPPVVEETFEVTLPERPQSPRIWKTFSVKIPSVLRSEVKDLPAFRIRAFEDPFFPPPVYTSSWIPPKGVRLPRGMTLEDYLYADEDTSAPPRVKVSKLFLNSSDLVEQAPVASTSDAVPLRDLQRDHTASVAVEEASFHSDAFIRSAMVHEEEDVATVPFEELEDDEETPAVIKVSLPKNVSQASSSQVQAASAAQEAASREAGRFKTYGPKLPENSTVAFRRGISPSKAVDATQLSSKNIFMVSSEINSNKEEMLPSFMRSYDQQVVDEVSAPSKAFAAISTASRHELKPSSPLEPVFPTLSPGTENSGQAGLNGMRREELPRHVIAELERLNATVSATPLTNPPRLDSPASLLAGRSTSPWAMGSKATIMPSALSLSAIDPSMSVWSKPTEETAAAAAAAFNSASKDAANDSVQENSLKDLVDDYPSSMPSNAMDLPISDGERPQSKDSESVRRSPSRSRSHDRHSHAMSISQVMNSTSPKPPTTGRSREYGSSRQGSFNFSPSQGYAVEGSPYAMSTQLPYAPSASSMHHQTVYSPALAHPQSQYGGYVAGTPTYAPGYSSTNGMLMSPAYASASPYPSMPVAMGSQDYSGRSASSHMAGQNGAVWVPNTGMMNGSFTSATAMSPYGSGAIPASGQGYGGHTTGKSRMHSSPMYGSQQQRASPIGSSDSHQHHTYSSYGYLGSGPTSSIPQHSPRHTFSPQLTSPGAQGSYPSQHANGSMSHLRSASAQQYGGRRQGW